MTPQLNRSDLSWCSGINPRATDRYLSVALGLIPLREFRQPWFDGDYLTLFMDILHRKWFTYSNSVTIFSRFFGLIYFFLTKLHNYSSKQTCFVRLNHDGGDDVQHLQIRNKSWAHLFIKMQTNISLFVSELLIGVKKWILTSSKPNLPKWKPCQWLTAERSCSRIYSLWSFHSSHGCLELDIEKSLDCFRTWLWGFSL